MRTFNYILELFRIRFERIKQAVRSARRYSPEGGYAYILFTSEYDGLSNVVVTMKYEDLPGLIRSFAISPEAVDGALYELEAAFYGGVDSVCLKRDIPLEDGNDGLTLRVVRVGIWSINQMSKAYRR